MNKKIEEICEDKPQTKESTVNNECCSNGINDGVRNADNSLVSPLETIMEMFERLQITPLSKINSISRSNHQNNYLFINKQSYEKPQEKNSGQEEYIIWGENDVKVAKNGAAQKSITKLQNLSQNLLMNNQNAKDETQHTESSTAHSLAKINGISFLGSNDNALEAKEVLEDKKDTSGTAKSTAPDIYNFTATPFYLPTKNKISRFKKPASSASKTSISLSEMVQQTGTPKSTSVFVFGDQNMQASSANSTSLSHLLSGNPKIMSSKSDGTTETQNTSFSTIDTAKTGLSTSVNSSPACFQNIKPSSLNSPAVNSEVKTCMFSFSTADTNGATTPAMSLKAIVTEPSTSENKEIIFNKTALMSMFDGSRKLFGTSMVQIPESTDLKMKKSQDSFPFRDKLAACAELSSKKSLCSQKKLWANSSIANTEFKMVLPTFRVAHRNVTSIHVFGGQEIPGTIFGKISIATSEKTVSAGPVFDKSAWMSVFDSVRNIFVTSPLSTDTNSYLDKSPAQVQVTRLTKTFHENRLNLFKYEDYKSAVSMFEDAIQLCPDIDTFYGIRAHYYMKLGKYKEAATDIRKVLSSDPSFTDGHICLAKCYIALGRISAANDAIARTRVAEGDSEGARALHVLRSLRALHEDTQRAAAAQDYARAVTCADRFLELCPSYTAKATKAKCLAMLGETEKALKLAEECLNNHDSDPEALYAKGLCLYYTSNEGQAVEYFEKVISAFPLHLGAIDSLQKTNKLLRLAKAETEAFNAGDYEKAITLNNEALATDESHKKCNFKLHIYNAVAYTKLKNMKLAVEACTSALEIEENSVRALKKRAHCYKQLEQYEDAVKDYEKVCKITDNGVNRKLLNSAKTLVQAKEKAYRDKVSSVESLVRTKKYQEALKLADECLQVRSSDRDVLYTKGFCYFYTGQYEKALQHLQEILNIEPKHTKAQSLFQKVTLLKNTLQQGHELFASGQWEKARYEYRCAQIIDFENSNLIVKMYCKVAETYLKENSLYNARKEYTLALEIDANCVEALLGRAKCFAEHNKYENAIEDYQRIYSIEECEERKQWVLDSIKTLKEKEEKMRKIRNAESLVLSRKMEDIELALNLAEECLRFDSTDTNALCVKGSCLYYKNQYEEALNQFQEILLLKPSHSTALQETKKITCLVNTIEKGDNSFKNGRWHDALNNFSEALNIDKLNNNLNVRLHCKMATIYLKLNDIRSAISEYTDALALDSNYLEALRGRAACFSKLDSYEAAIKDFEKCINDKNEVDKVWIKNYIVALKENIAYRDKLEEAENLIAGHKSEKLNLAQQLAEECLQFRYDKRPLCVKGLCLYYKEEYEQALDIFKEILRLDPLNSTALKETKKISYLRQTIEKGEDSFTNGRWQDALDKFNEALTIDEHHKRLNVKLYCKTAMAIKFMNGGNTHAAIRDYTKALVLDSNCVVALFGRAQCYKELLQYEDAMKDCEKLYSIDQSEETKQFIQKIKTVLHEQNHGAAVEKAEAGNKLYKRKKFRDALSMYKQAISLDPDTAEYYSKTFSCYINLSMSKEAFADAKMAVALDAKCSKSYDGIAKCYLALGDLFGAERAIIKASDAGSDCTDDRRVLEMLQRLHAQAQRYVNEQSYERAVACMDQCLESSPFSSRVKLIKAECLATLGKVEQALEIADDCIRLDKSDIEALYVKGLCIYYNEKHEQALKYFKELLRLSPDHVKATSAYKKAKLLMQKKEQGNEEFKAGRWQKALLLYNEALTVDPTHIKVNAKLHFNKATVHKKLNQTQAAADACTAALELDENYVKALTLRAKCFTELEEYDCVIDDYEQLYKIDPSDEIKQLLEQAKRSHNQRSRCKNYYSILGLNKSATKPDIKRAYRQLSLVHHPDRHSGRSKFERKRQERRFQEVLEAYTVLSDPAQRRKYDVSGTRTWEDDDDDDDYY